jgi:hypothetical protein
MTSDAGIGRAGAAIDWEIITIEPAAGVSGHGAR